MSEPWSMKRQTTMKPENTFNGDVQVITLQFRKELTVLPFYCCSQFCFVLVLFTPLKRDWNSSHISLECEFSPHLPYAPQD